MIENKTGILWRQSITENITDDEHPCLCCYRKKGMPGFITKDSVTPAETVYITALVLNDGTMNRQELQLCNECLSLLSIKINIYLTNHHTIT